jgi:hypothetical protein
MPFAQGNTAAAGKGAAKRKELEQFRALMESDPEAARRILTNLSHAKFVPHMGQKPVMDSHARFKLMCAGRRFGKTKIAAAIGHRKVRERQRMVWWVAPTYKVVKRGYAEVIRQLPKGVLTHTPAAETSFDAGRSVVLKFKTGSRWEFYSAERPDGMLGEGVDMAIMDEAATMQEHIWTQIIRPTLADRQGESLFISTPRGRNWFYKMYLAGQDPLRQDYESWRFPSMANPYIPAEEWEEMEQTLPRAVYEQEILADFISNAAAVFRETEKAVRPLQRPAGHVVLGIDLAKHNDFTVLCGIRSGDRMPCYHDRFNTVSWPEQRARIHRAVEKIEAKGATTSVMLDSTGIGDVVYDDLGEEGLDVVPIKFTPQWKQKAVMLLAADIERGQAFLHEKQLNEFDSYSYEITDAGRWKYEAASGHDDEVSAMLLAHWGVVNEGIPDIRMITMGPASSDGSESDYWGDDEGVVDGQIVEETVEPPTHRQLLTAGW